MNPWMVTGIGLDSDVAGEELTTFDTVARKGWMIPDEQRRLYELACDLLDALRKAEASELEAETAALRHICELAREHRRKWIAYWRPGFPDPTADALDAALEAIEIREWARRNNAE